MVFGYAVPLFYISEILLFNKIVFLFCLTISDDFIIILLLFLQQ